MKRFFSIALVAIFLLNVMGYYGVFLGMQYQNDIAMRKVLDNHRYSESQTITVKVPISIPYMSDNADFERVDGMFEYQGEFYRLVKQKYAKDTLTIVCVKDFENKRIHQALSNYVKTFNEKAPVHNQGSKITVNFIKDYISQYFSIKSISSGWESDTLARSFCNELIPSYITSILHPPEHS